MTKKDQKALHKQTLNTRESGQNGRSTTRNKSSCLRDITLLEGALRYFVRKGRGISPPSRLVDCHCEESRFGGTTKQSHERRDCRAPWARNDRLFELVLLRSIA